MSPFFVESTASFDEAVVIDSDDDDDQAECHSIAVKSGQFDPQNDRLKHGNDSEAPTQPSDSPVEPHDLAIIVSLPLRSKLSTACCRHDKSPQQRNASSCSRPRLKSRGQEVIDSVSSDTKMFRSYCVADEASDVEPDVDIAASGLPFPAKCVDSFVDIAVECQRISHEAAAEAVRELVVSALSSLRDVCCSMEPHDRSSSPSTDSSSDSASLQQTAPHSESVHTEPPNTAPAENPPPPDGRVVSQTLPKKIGVPAVPSGKAEEPQNSAVVAENVVVKLEDGRISERTSTDTDTSAADERHSSANDAFDDSDICRHENRPLLPLLDTPSTQPVIDSEVVKHTDISSGVVDEPVAAVVGGNHRKTVRNSRARLHFRTKMKSRIFSRPRDFDAISVKAGKIKKAALRRGTPKQTTSRVTRFNKWRKARKGCRRPLIHMGLKKEKSTAVLSSMDGRILDDTRGEVENVTYKYTEIEQCGKHKATDARPEYTHPQLATSLGHTSTSLGETCDESSLVGDQPANPQVVAVQLSKSPVHPADGEVEEYTVESTEPAFSPSDPDWMEASSGNNKPNTYSHAELRNRLQGVPVYFDMSFSRFLCVRILCVGTVVGQVSFEC